MELYVTYDENRRGGEALEPGEWAFRAPTYIEVTVNGLYLEQPQSWGWENVPVRGELFQPKEGERVFLLVVRHSDGDTFGTTHGHAHFEGIYETREAAEAIAETINQDTYKSGRGKWNYIPWKGYFAQLEDIEIHAITVGHRTNSTPYKLVNH